MTDIERLGYGQCVYADVGNQDLNYYRLPTLNCASFGLSSDCYYSFGLLKSANFGWDYGFGQSSCPWWNITSGGSLVTSELCDGVPTRQGISHIFYCVDAPKPCHLETCLCAEWQLRNFALSGCGATVTWRVWNYCANSPYWIKFNVAGLGDISGISVSSPSGVSYNFASSIIASDGDFSGARTLAFTQTGSFNSKFGWFGSPDYNYIDVTFTVSNWPGADYDWYMGAHMGTYWDYYNTKDYFDGDWSTCQQSRSSECGADTCGVYCCTNAPVYGTAPVYFGGGATSCPVGTKVGSTVGSNECTLDCDCQLTNCLTTEAPTTTQQETTTQSGDTTTAGATTTASGTTEQGTTQEGTTEQGTTQQGTTQQGTTQQGTTKQGTTAQGTTPAPTTTAPPLPCELTGTCVTLPPVTQNPNVPTKTACPGDCNGHGTCNNGVCVCDTGLASTVEGATVDYTGVDCSTAVIVLPEATCTAFTSCDLCNTATNIDCKWLSCAGAGVCVAEATVAVDGCTVVTACAGTVVFAPGECPDNCSGAGVCTENGTCICKKGVSGINCGSRKGLSAAAKAAAISGGVIAAIVICGVIIIVVLSFGAKKAVDWVVLNEQAAAKSHVSPLYQDTPGAGTNSTYVPK